MGEGTAWCVMPLRWTEMGRLFRPSREGLRAGMLGGKREESARGLRGEEGGGERERRRSGGKVG